MPRKKAVPTEATIADLTIHQRIARAAHLFTQEILHILGSSTLEELTSLSAGEGEAQRLRGRVAPVERRRSAEFLKRIGRIPVRCPVPACTERGIRSKMNFCAEHAASIPRAEQLRLREAQKAERAEGGAVRPLLPKGGAEAGGKAKRTSQPAATA